MIPLLLIVNCFYSKHGITEKINKAIVVLQYFFCEQ